MIIGKTRKVVQIKNGVEIKIYDSVTDAAAAVNRTTSNISRACIRGSKSSDFHWKYHEELDPDEFWVKHPILDIHCSNLGRIKSHRNRIFKPSIDSDGYLQTIINGRRYKIHRLIAQTFHENPEEKPTVDHLDRNRTNNNFWNLRWATMKEQSNNRCNNLIQNKIIY